MSQCPRDWLLRWAKVLLGRIHTDSGDRDCCHCPGPSRPFAKLVPPVLFFLSAVNVARENLRRPVKFEFQMQYLEHIYTKISLIVYLTFKFNWVVCIFICLFWKTYSQCFLGESRVTNGKTEALGQGHTQGRRGRRHDRRLCPRFLIQGTPLPAPPAEGS